MIRSAPSMFDKAVTRKRELAWRRKLPWLSDTIAEMDAVSPGWKRAWQHEIVGRVERNGYSMDLVYELPGRVFIRGWDMTGAINR